MSYQDFRYIGVSISNKDLLPLLKQFMNCICDEYVENFSADYNDSRKLSFDLCGSYFTDELSSLFNGSVDYFGLISCEGRPEEVLANHWKYGECYGLIHKLFGDVKVAFVSNVVNTGDSFTQFISNFYISNTNIKHCKNVIKNDNGYSTGYIDFVDVPGLYWIDEYDPLDDMDWEAVKSDVEQLASENGISVEWEENEDGIIPDSSNDEFCNCCRQFIIENGYLEELGTTIGQEQIFNEEITEQSVEELIAASRTKGLNELADFVVKTV